MLQASLIKILVDSRLRLIVWLLLLALLAYQISLLFWQFFPKPELTPALTTRPVATQGSDRVQKKSYLDQANAISGAYLFGKAEVEAEVQVVAEEAPETRLNYKLRGVYFSEDPASSSAIVEVKPNDSKHYFIGDELAENIIMSAVAKDHILIDRYGKIERLNLQKPVVSEKDNSLPAAGLSASSAANTRLLQSYKKRYVSNPLALAKRFQAIPVQENGRNIGFRLKALRGESLLKKLNFQDNDIFTKINGIALDKPFQALDALKSLTTANSVSVTIIRNGNEETREFSL